MKNKILIAPSILSANFAQLGAEVRDVEEAGADWIHVDIMDGHFVPNITIGPMVVEALKPLTKLPLDCHLMVQKPEDWVEPFAHAGASQITVHVEASTHLNRLLTRIRELGCKAGVSLNPATPIQDLTAALDLIDVVLVMSVNPGFGGQKFMPSSFDRIRKLNELRGKRKFLIEVDGGVGPQNINELVKAGADVLVAGKAIFSRKDRKKTISDLRRAIL